MVGVVLVEERDVALRVLEHRDRAVPGLFGGRHGELDTLRAELLEAGLQIVDSETETGVPADQCRRVVRLGIDASQRELPPAVSNAA